MTRIDDVLEDSELIGNESIVYCVMVERGYVPEGSDVPPVYCVAAYLDYDRAASWTEGKLGKFYWICKTTVS